MMKTATVEMLHYRMQKDPNSISVVDVRTKQEFDAEHIQEALHIPQTEMENESVLHKLPKEKTPYLICRSGARSKAMQSLLYQRGVTDTYNVIGGMLMWKAMQFPTTKR